ncbi:MAG: hypothetical protein IPJ79_08825 [Bacteroidetes bacterium]|nr:hypothetical protein [Bacteroidota bacterium]
MLLIAANVTLLSAQTTGDYRTSATGNWSSASIWERYNGSAWVGASVAPSSAGAGVVFYKEYAR